ncbi:MAG: IclR family transcriptional regulator [Pseudomonadota bacterium]
MAKTEHGEGPKERVDSTLFKGLMILETLAAAPDGFGVTELSRQLGLTKSNTFRLLQSLCTLGYVRRRDDRLYVATTKVWKVGLLVMEQFEVRDYAAPDMRHLSELTGETIYLAILDGASLLYIDKIEGTQPIRTWTPKGGNVPIHSVGTGKALLAYNYDSLRGAVIGTLEGFTEKTITTAQKLDEEVAKIRKAGVAIDWGEYRAQVYSIGAPIFGPGGAAIAAIGVSVPAANCTKSEVKKIAAQVIEAAGSITRKIAHA